MPKYLSFTPSYSWQTCSKQIYRFIGCVGVTCWLTCYLLEIYRLCRCNVLIELLLVEIYRLCRCNVLIVIWMLVKCRLCGCSVLVEMLLFASYRLCTRRFVIGVLLIIDYRLCSLLRSNRNIIAWKFQAVSVYCIDLNVLLL